jgi:hypothetical protein
VLDLHGWGELADELYLLSLQSRWAEMGNLIDNEVLNEFAVVVEPSNAAAELRRRFGDLMTRLTIYAPYTLDAAIGVRIVTEMQGSPHP